MVPGKPQTDPTLEWFLSHCHIHKYPSKSTLIHAGEKAETLYYIVKGSVAVLIKDEEGKEMILSYLNQGDFIGELGLFEEGQERTAWVRAKTPCEVAEISFKKFRQLIQVNPDILMRLSAQMATRLQVFSMAKFFTSISIPACTSLRLKVEAPIALEPIPASHFSRLVFSRAPHWNPSYKGSHSSNLLLQCSLLRYRNQSADL